MKEEIDKTLQMPLKPRDNLTYKQRQALRKLMIDDTIIINKADKGSTIVIQDRDTYTQRGLDHLKDTTTYIELNIDPTTTLIQNIDQALKEMHRNKQLTTKQHNLLIPPHNARTPHIYFLK